MKFVTGSTEKQVMEISDVLAQLDSLAGKEIRMNGAIHTIRDMGDVAFVVLRNGKGWSGPSLRLVRSRRRS